MTTTRSLAIVGERDLEVISTELPAIGPDDLLVEVKAGGVCKADLVLYENLDGVTLPFVGGHESAGVVLEVGATVTNISPGDNVALLGGGRFAELTVAHQSQAALLPPDIDDWAGGVLEPLACAANGLDVARVRLDDVVGVVGCGYMGLLVTRMLALSPVRQIVAMDIDDAALDRARSSGASLALNVTTSTDAILENLRETLDKRPMPTAFVLDWIPHGPLDIVFEASGTSAGLQLATQLVRVGGTLVMFGHQQGRVEIDGSYWHMNGIRVENASPMSSVDFKQVFYRTAALVRAGRVTAEDLVTHRAPIDQANSVFAAAADRSYVKGAVLFN